MILDCVVDPQGAVAYNVPPLDALETSQGGLSDDGVLHVRGNPAVTTQHTAPSACTSQLACAFISSAQHNLLICLLQDVQRAFSHLDVDVAAERRGAVMQWDSMARCAVRCHFRLLWHYAPAEPEDKAVFKQDGVVSVITSVGQTARRTLSNDCLSVLSCRQLQPALCSVLRVRYVVCDNSIKYAEPSAKQMVHFCACMLQFPDFWVRLISLVVLKDG